MRYGELPGRDPDGSRQAFAVAYVQPSFLWMYRSGWTTKVAIRRGGWPLSVSTGPADGQVTGVEVAGIEPASLSDEPDLLRAHPTVSFYSALTLASALGEQAQSHKCP